MIVNVESSLPVKSNKNLFTKDFFDALGVEVKNRIVNRTRAGLDLISWSVIIPCCFHTEQGGHMLRISRITPWVFLLGAFSVAPALKAVPPHRRHRIPYHARARYEFLDHQGHLLALTGPVILAGPEDIEPTRTPRPAPGGSYCRWNAHATLYGSTSTAAPPIGSISNMGRSWLSSSCSR